MYCSNCGNKILENDKFCTKCGFDLNNQRCNDKINNNKNNQHHNESNGLALASLIIGAASFMFISLAPITLIASIVGLILGIISKNKCTEKKVGIILNIIGIVLSFFITLVLILFFIGGISVIEDVFDDKLPIQDQNVFGVWDCKEETFGKFGEEDNVISLYLNKNLTFKWQTYTDELNEYYYGEYSYSVLDRRNDNQTYYLLQFIGMAYDKNNKLQNETFTEKYTFYIDFEEQSAVLRKEETNERYICSYKMGSVSEV